MPTNDTPLWKSYMFPFVGFAFDIVVMAFYGLPPILPGLLALALFVGGCVWTYADWKTMDESTSNVPAILAAIGPLLVLIFTFAN